MYVSCLSHALNLAQAESDILCSSKKPGISLVGFGMYMIFWAMHFIFLVKL